MGKITFDVVSLINLFGVVYAVLFSLIVVKYKKGEKITNRILAALMLSLAFIILSSFLITSDAYYFYPHLFKIAPLFYLLVGPLLYFYIMSLTRRHFQVKPTYLLHLLPFAVNVLAYLPFYLSAEEAKSTVVDSFFTVRGVHHIELSLFLVFRLIHLLVYLLLCFHLIARHSGKLREVFSSRRAVQLGWMKTLVWAFASVFLAYFLFFALRVAGGELSRLAVRWLSVWETVLVIYLSYKSLTQPDIFRLNGAARHSGSGIPEAEVAHLLEILRRHMAREKPYLNADLTIKDLSTAISLPYWHISRMINEHLQQNFFEFVNRYRIEEAKRLINGNRGKNMLEIAYEVGFNSKSAFNASFKKIVGQTPSQYKNLRK